MTQVVLQVEVLVTLVRYLYTQRAIHEFEYTASFLPTDSSLFATPSPTRPHVRDREAWCREARAEARDRASGLSTCDGLPSRPYAILRWLLR